jgi:citrate lyase subunit beta/citryl-CoA lyase
MNFPISYLFVPGNRPDRFDKALAAGADAVIVDLEDAVSPETKADARRALRAWLPLDRDRAGKVLVRINNAASSWFEDDLALVRECGIRGVLLSKTEDAQQVARVASALPRSNRAGFESGFVIALIETARGVQNAEAIAAAPGVQRLAFGMLDYLHDLEMSGDERGLYYPCSRFALASRAAGIASPVAGVTTQLDNEQKIVEEIAFARAFGFGAKLCIHPKQIAVVHRAYAPGDEELAWAKRVLAAAQDGPGALQVDGKMVDLPVILRAQSIVGRAAR